MENNENQQEELNYKRAYFYLFNNITKLIQSLEEIQSKAEEICIEEPTSENAEFDADEILKNIITNIQDNQ